MNVEEIVKLYLKEHGYDGLWNDDDECACTLDDLVPCGEFYPNCKAGYLQKCTSEEKKYWGFIIKDKP